MNLLQNQKLNNKKAIIRVDLNVPLNEKKEVTDYTRIEAIKETVNFVIDNGGSCILLSHLGRPRGKDKNLSLKNILGPVSKTLDKPVVFFQDCIGEDAEQATKKLQQGEIILMENLRFYKEETDGDNLFAEKLSRLGDLYINDAFGTCHREHASTAVIAKYFPNDKYVGKLLQKELEAISQIAEHGEKPVLAILGGPKVSSKLNILYNLIKKVDKIIIGGGMAYTFIAAQGGKIGDSLIEEDLIENAKEILEIANSLNKEIILPDDIKASTDFDQNDLIKTFDSNKIENGWMDVKEIFLIGPSISILVEGYFDKRKNILSLRGTLIPAKTLNSLVSKIPILGDILIGKKTGDGLFGVSFKIKGPTNNLKTTVNPVKTLTPRFITRTLEEYKKKEAR